MEQTSATIMEQTTSSDLPGVYPNTNIEANDLPSYSEQKNSSLELDFDQAKPAEIEKQPRAIDWSDIVTACAWPQVILMLLHIPTILAPQGILSDIGFPQPWVRNDRLCFVVGWCLGPAVLSSFQGNHLGRMLLYKAFLPILWQQLVATYLESTELGWWWKEMVGWVLVVAGGQLLILTANLYLGEYAWPEAPREEQRKALEKSLERRREAFEAEEEVRHEYRRKWGGGGKKEQARAGADWSQHGDAWSVKDLKAGVDGRWEVTDELIATVFKRPSHGGGAIKYFFSSAACVFLPLALTLGTLSYRVLLHSPWQGNQVLAYILCFVGLLWLNLMFVAAIVLRELPDDTSGCWFVQDRIWVMLGGENTSEARRLLFPGWKLKESKMHL